MTYCTLTAMYTHSNVHSLTKGYTLPQKIRFLNTSNAAEDLFSEYFVTIFRQIIIIYFHCIVINNLSKNMLLVFFSSYHALDLNGQLFGESNHYTSRFAYHILNQISNNL